MKKTYISPDMEMVKIETAQMLAASVLSLDADTEEGLFLDDDGIDDIEILR